MGTLQLKFIRDGQENIEEQEIVLKVECDESKKRREALNNFKLS